MSPRSAGRTGWRWRQVSAQVRAESTHCWLCGRSLDPLLPWPHPWSTSVHHVVTLAAGGHPTDRANLAAAHLRCNMQYGDGTTMNAKDLRVPSLNNSREW